VIKIIFSANTSWFIYNFYKDLIKGLVLKKYKIYILAPFDDNTHKLKETGCTVFNLKMDNKGSNPLKDIKTLALYLNYYRKIKPDYCFHFTIKPNMYGTLAAKYTGAISINTVTGLGTIFITNTWVSKIAQLLYRLTQPFAYKIFVLNQDDLQILSNLHIAPLDRIVLVPGSGINLEYFTPSIITEQCKQFTFLYIGRILKDKGICELVEASRILKSKGYKFQTVLVGYLGVENRSAISFEQIQQWISEDIIDYQGSTQDVRPWLNRADCIVLPSYREGLPQSLLEASAMKKPIIATRVPGCKEVVLHGKTGLLCNVKDPISLAESMQTIFQMKPHEREEMGSNGRSYVASKYAASKVYAYYTSVLRDSVTA
jgi:glycosyltransferase involved in cell wall biosynthesis